MATSTGAPPACPTCGPVARLLNPIGGLQCSICRDCGTVFGFRLKPEDRERLAGE